MTLRICIWAALRMSCKKGVTAIEFAIVFPFVLVFTFAIVEIGWLMFSIAQVINVATEISRERSLNSISSLTTASISNVAEEKINAQAWYTIDSENLAIYALTGSEKIDGFVEFNFEYQLDSLFIGSSTLLDVSWSIFSYDVLIPGKLE